MPAKPMHVRPSNIRKGAAYQPRKMSELEFHTVARLRGMTECPTKQAMYCIYVLGMRRFEAARVSGLEAQAVWSGVRLMERWLCGLHGLADYIPLHETTRETYKAKQRRDFGPVNSH